MIARFSAIWILFGSSSPHPQESPPQKNVVRVGPPLAKLSGSAHEPEDKVSYNLISQDRVDYDNKHIISLRGSS